MAYLRKFFGGNLSAHVSRPVLLVLNPRFSDNL